MSLQGLTNLIHGKGQGWRRGFDRLGRSALVTDSGQD
jgi:hypothetical protein